MPGCVVILRPMPFAISPRDLEAVRDAQNFDSLKELSQKVVEKLGFDWFMYGMMRKEEFISQQPLAFFLGTYDPEYVKLFSERQWYRIDPPSVRMLASDLPQVWRRSDFDTPESQEILEVSARYGVRAGATFPVGPSNMTIGGLGIAKDADPDAEYEKTLKILPYGQLLSIYMHSAVQRLMKVQTTPLAKAISPRELQCLQLAARGLRDAEISKKLKITTRTVISHINSSREKLQAENRSQMIAKAMALKIIGI